MSDTRNTPPGPDPATDPIAYVRQAIWPPLPTAFGAWLRDLAHRAKAGADPNLELAVPDAVLETGIPVPVARKTDDGTVVTTLGRALTLFHAEHLLFPDDTEHSEDPVAIFEPGVALTLANTADAKYAADCFDLVSVNEMAAQLTNGEWDYRLVSPIRVDRQGRLTTGLNTLLAIVKANAPAPAMAYYDTPADGQPLTWRGPAGWGLLEN
jgi:hypothetical protein